jgi:multiple sugar transport system ATP-binding protein
VADVRLIDVTRRYTAGDAPAVDRVSLEVPDGQLFALLGPSGCGKSTLLKLIGGLEEPDEGEIHIGSRLVNFVSPGRRDVAMVFQSYALYPHMTARENIRFPLRMRKVPRGEAARAVDRAAEVLELGELLGRKVESLSGGQRQRVAVARAIVRDPAVLLMDEPLSNLDALLRMHTREELLRLHRTVPGTILYVTHDQVEAMTMGDRIGVMDRGRLAQVARRSRSTRGRPRASSPASSAPRRCRSSTGS